MVTPKPPGTHGSPFCGAWAHAHSHKANPEHGRNTSFAINKFPSLAQMSRLCLSVPLDFHFELRLGAVELGASMSRIAVEAIVPFLALHLGYVPRDMERFMVNTIDMRKKKTEPSGGIIIPTPEPPPDPPPPEEAPITE
jgi:hypothetical protein